jgi:hypothetical protein
VENTWVYSMKVEVRTSPLQPREGCTDMLERAEEEAEHQRKQAVEDRRIQSSIARIEKAREAEERR